MPMNQGLIPEFDHEMANTRKTLERVPDNKWDWKPDPKSGTLGWLANHVAGMTLWAADTFTTDSFDFAPGGKQVEMPNAKNRAELMAIFDKGVKETRKALDAIAEALDRDKSYVVNDALAAYVETHRWQAEHIRQGLRRLNYLQLHKQDDVNLLRLHPRCTLQVFF